MMFMMTSLKFWSRNSRYQAEQSQNIPALSVATYFSKVEHRSLTPHRFPSRVKLFHCLSRRVFHTFHCIFICVLVILCQLPVLSGGDPHPRSVSGRCVLGFWWLFTILMASTYTANLAAFLTVTIARKPINSLEELVAQSQIKPFVMDGSSYETLLQARFA